MVAGIPESKACTPCGLLNVQMSTIRRPPVCAAFISGYSDTLATNPRMIWVQEGLKAGRFWRIQNSGVRRQRSEVGRQKSGVRKACQYIWNLVVCHRNRKTRLKVLTVLGYKQC